jgi:hypothetical protein
LYCILRLIKFFSFFFGLNIFQNHLVYFLIKKIKISIAQKWEIKQIEQWLVVKFLFFLFCILSLLFIS